jgi:hypothetical protein
MSVVKPTIFDEPSPLTSHWEGGFPGRQFSATISFAGAAQGSLGWAATLVMLNRSIDRIMKVITLIWDIIAFACLLGWRLVSGKSFNESPKFVSDNYLKNITRSL